jgi:hypothetical protein
MSVLGVVIAVPVGLDGDSLAGNSAAIAGLALASMIIGYVLLAGLWYFVFRRSPAEREADRQAQEALAEAVRQWRPAVGPAREDEPERAASATPSGRINGQPLRIERTPGSRFRRR